MFPFGGSTYRRQATNTHSQKPWLANSCKGHSFTSLQTDMNIGSKINWIYEYRSRPAKLPQCHSCFELHSLQTRISSGETPLAGRCRRNNFLQESAFENCEFTIHLYRLPHFCHTLHQGVGFVILKKKCVYPSPTSHVETKCLFVVHRNTGALHKIRR